MVYRFSTEIFDNATIFQENVLAERSYFIPFSGRQRAEHASHTAERYESDRVRVLSGDWDFKFIEDGKIPAEFDTNLATFDAVTVPSSFESCGYLQLAYKTGYPFDFSPPRITCGKDNKNAVGVYRHSFEASDLSKRYLLSFLRVGGAFSVYLNGEYVGYAERGAAEFDVTALLVVGSNELVVVVKKWTASAYMFEPNGFPATGLTGDVLLTVQDRAGLFDYRIGGKINDKSSALKISVKLFETEGVSVRVSLERDGAVVLEETQKPEGEFSLTYLGKLSLYTMENPVLYHLYISIIRAHEIVECVRIPVGFRQKQTLEGVLNYNSHPLKIRGINYNSIYNKDGKILTREEMYRDILLIKAYNFNAVQLLVPVDPEFVRMCSLAGLYVIESFPVSTHAAKLLGEKKVEKLARIPYYKDICMDRVKWLYERDKNNVATVMWSFGDTLGTSPLINTAIDYIKSNTSSLVVYDAGEREDYDVAALFHPSIEKLFEEINRVAAKKPVFMSEYAYSAGVGCANLKEFYEVIENTPCCLGGCISNFADEVIGGVGCADSGLFTVERKPYPGAFSAQYTYRPVTARLTSSSILEVTNASYYANTGDIVMYLCIQKDGTEISRTEVDINLKPREARDINIFLGDIEGDMYLNIIYRSKKYDYEIAREQLPIHGTSLSIEKPRGRIIEVTDLFDFVDIRFESGIVRFSKEMGNIIKYAILGNDILKPDPTRMGGNCFNANIFRPFLRNLVSKEKLTVDTVLRDFNVIRKEDRVEVDTEIVYLFNRKESHLVQDKYTVFGNGIIEVFSVITPLRRNLPPLDCFGKQIRLRKSFGNITYYGRGESDNYIDMCEHSQIGLYHAEVSDFNKTYVFPQECGNRTEVKYVLAKDNDGFGIMLLSKQNGMNLRVSKFSDLEIRQAHKNRVREIPQSGVYLDFNSFVSGIGNSDNGKPIAKYLVKPAEYTLQFDFIPVVPENFAMLDR